jgi:hypothetical protein
VKKRQISYAIVYIPHENVYGEVVKYGSYASLIYYMKDGFAFESFLLNEDFEIIEEINIEEIEEYE